MTFKKKYSMFISSTYEDLKEERQAVIGVALEKDIIPVGMEQFHAAPASQWNVITKMIDECDGYMLIIGGRYGSIDDDFGISYTEKEYNYAKSKGLPVLVLIRKDDAIIASKMDTGDTKHTKQEKMDLLLRFKDKVKKDGNTVDFFSDINDLRYRAAQALSNSIDYFPEDSGWVRYSELKDAENALMIKNTPLSVSTDNVIQNAEYTLVGKNIDSPGNCDSEAGKFFLSILEYFEEKGIKYSKEGDEKQDKNTCLSVKGMQFTYCKSFPLVSNQRVMACVSVIKVLISSQDFNDSLSLLLDVLRIFKENDKKRILLNLNPNYGVVQSAVDVSAIICRNDDFTLDGSKVDSYIYSKREIRFCFKKDIGRKRMANLLGGVIYVEFENRTVTSEGIIELINRLVEIGCINKISI